ncbi:MAG TPA: YdeI/OmpD-associated family protein [Terriglobales bacterium]|nr:YdeI/OmpD-associated family protein [Terriglobales bacterium]
MSVKKFRAKLGSAGRPLFVIVPLDVRKEFGKARPPVKVSVNGYSYRSTICVYGGKYYLPVRSDHREAAGVKAGDIVEVTIVPDNEVRRVEVPPELSAALAKDRRAKESWEKLSYSNRREHANAIITAKKPETRARRLESTLKKLVALTGD